MAVSNGIPDNRGQWSKKYSDGSELHYSTYTTYNTGQGGRGLDPSSVKTYLVYERPRGVVTEWVTAGELGVDGKITPLKNSQAFRIVDGQLQELGSGGLYDYPENNYVLGDLARKDLSSGGTSSLRYQTINNAKKLLQKDSGVSAEEVNRAYDISSNINPPASDGTPGLFGDPVGADEPTSPPAPSQDPALTPDQVKEFDEERKSVSRSKYSDLIYPIGLGATKQDYIKFSILKYTPPGLEETFSATNVGRRRPENIKENQIIGSVILPIPGGIQDNNLVDWSDSTIDSLTKAFADLAMTGITGGNVGANVQQKAENVGNNIKDFQKAIIGKFTGDAVKSGNLMQRQFGVMINPNLELLFNGPRLRSFGFSFKLSPRSSDEAKIVKAIIRTFKQSMSVQRSATTFLLQTPNTFKISYIFQDKDHPYLNIFKECALTNCRVNYTPEGNYMSFDDSNEPSMVSYQLDLEFQELEPIYNDDYTTFDKDTDTFIGY